MSIFERLGQEHGVRTAVDGFYQRVLADPELTAYFDGVDMRRLRGHQAALLVQVTGGPAIYAGRDLSAAHDHLDIAPEDFDRVVGHLVATLTDLGVADGDIAEIGTALTAHRPEIVAAN